MKFSFLPNNTQNFTQHVNSAVNYLLAARAINPDEWPWPLRLTTMWLGYLSIVAPLYLLVIFIRKWHEAGQLKPISFFSRFLIGFGIGYRAYMPLLPTTPKAKKESNVATESFATTVFWFTVDVTGIMVTLLIMGWLQERIVTQAYVRVTDHSQTDMFKDMQFLVFSNRVVALVVASIVLYTRRRNQPPHANPYYVHGYTSFSNTMSSWFQYEALKYVSFPTQTICKVSKVVATMIMGTIVRKQRYSLVQYFHGAGIAFGAGMFLMNTGEHSHAVSATSISGFILMAGYLVFDSFTLNWQKALFDTDPKPSKNQMMFGVNCFSVILTLASLLEQGTLWSSIEFAFTHKDFLLHNFTMSLCSAISQLFIYATIERFGPVVFSIVMTCRQIGSILISTILYNHPVTVWSGVGLLVCFAFIFLNTYHSYQQASSRRADRSMPKGGGKKQKKKARVKKDVLKDKDIPEGMTKETAMEYIGQIKKEFCRNPNVYEEFTQILKDFDAFQISTDAFINKVCGLFSEKPHLVTGLNQFLPDGFKIKQEENGEYRCTVEDSFSKGHEKVLKMGHEYSATNTPTVKDVPPPSENAMDPIADALGSEEALHLWELLLSQQGQSLEEFVYDRNNMQELYKAYCKERNTKNVEAIKDRGRAIRRQVVPLLLWLKDEYFTDSQKGMLFTKMIRSIKKIFMLENRWFLFDTQMTPELGQENAELVKTEFLNHHCMAYTRLVEGYMQTNDCFKEEDTKQPKQCSSKS